MPSIAQTVLLSCLVGAHAAFNCTLYASTCSGVTGYEAYGDCASTVASNNMTCRETHLALAAKAGGAATHCPHAQPSATGPCATAPGGKLKAFNCTLFASTCSGKATSYTDCANTVANNNANHMACRTRHLELAAASGGAATHCPHAQFAAAAPCATEKLKTFDCALYVSTCSGVTGYKAYSDCAATVTANSAGMQCRIQHLTLAAKSGGAATHCPHAQPNATGPCASYTLTAATTTTSGTTGATTTGTSATGTSLVSSTAMNSLSGLCLMALMGATLQ